jgi:transcriptional regulator with XRE-family HTH domain
MKQKKSLRQLAKELGVSVSYLSQIRHGKRPASKKVLSKLDMETLSNWGAPIFSTTYNERHPAFSTGCLTSVTWFFS